MPDWKALVRVRVESLRLQATQEAELIEELAQHLEDKYQQLLADGWSDEPARQKALEELSGIHQLSEGFAHSDRMSGLEPVAQGAPESGNWLADLGRDTRFALRGFRKNIAFTFFVVLTLALGIGANTTVFTVIDTLLLNPLPVTSPSTVAGLSTSDSKNKKRDAGALPISFLNLQDLRDKNDVFAELAGYTSPRALTWSTDSGPQRLFAEFATGNYFSTLGLKPAAGRFFSKDEDSTTGSNPVAVMNYASWQGRFGGATDIVGRKLRVNNIVVTVIGVAPKGFLGVNVIFGPDLWVPVTMAGQVLPGELKDGLRNRGKAFLSGVGRLKPGVSLSQAAANITTIAANLAKEYPQFNEAHTISTKPISEAVFGDAASSGGRSGLVFGSAVLLGVVGLVLLIACSNVANLLLARSTARRQEIAVRLAIGASRARLIRQMLTESAVLGLLSGVVGTAFGYAGSRFLWSFRPAEVAPNLFQIKMDVAVLWFALAMSLVTGLVFGIVPAIRTSRGEVIETLKEETRSGGRSRRGVTFGNVLLAGQVAFSFVALVTAALFLRSLGRAYQIDPGFQTKHLAVFMTNPGETGYNEAQTKDFYRQVRDRVLTLPGIATASWASNLPLWNAPVPGVLIAGQERRSKVDTISAVVNTVDVDYLATSGVALTRGRDFNDLDQENSTPVAIVNEEMARRYWPNKDPIGKRLQLPGEKSLRQIVGVARTAKYSTLGETPQLCIYRPAKQNFSASMNLYVRTHGDPAAELTAVEREIHAVGPQVEASDSRTGSKLIDQALFAPKMGVGLLSVFGFLALGLASIGLYGILAYSVNQRKREIGVRIALGAGAPSVLRLILGQGMALVTSGIGLGLVGSFIVGRVLSRMLYGVSAMDPVSEGAAVLVLLIVALAACYLPACGASRVDPLVALREG